MFDAGIAAKARPFVVISRADESPPRAITVLAPLTTSYRGSGYEVSIGTPRFLREESYVNLQGVQAVLTVKFGRYLGRLDEATMAKIRSGLRFVFDL